MPAPFAALDWALLERRLAEEEIYPVARAELLAGPLDCPRAAAQAALGALTGAPSDLTALLLALELALALDDPAVAQQAFDHAMAQLVPGGLSPVALGALCLDWLLVWTLRWPDEARAARAAQAAAPYDALRLGDVLADFQVDTAARVARARRRLAGAADNEERQRLQRGLGRLLLRSGAIDEGLALVEAGLKAQPLQASPAEADGPLITRWHRLEIQWRRGDLHGALRTLEALAGALPEIEAAALWHLAGDLADRLGRDPDPLYARAAEAPGPLILALKRLQRAAQADDGGLEALAVRTVEAAERAAHPGLKEILSVRAAELCLDADLAEPMERVAGLDVASGSRALERLRWRQGRLDDLLALLGRRPQGPAVILIRAALMAWSQRDLAGAAALLAERRGDLEAHPLSALVSWRLAQRLSPSRAPLRAEANAQEDAQRRGALLLRVVHRALAEGGARLDAHVALEAALALDPRHPTALIYGVELGRLSGRPGPWAEALARAITALCADGVGPLGQALIGQLAALAPATPKVARHVADELPQAVGRWLSDPITAGHAVALLRAGERYLILEDLLRRAAEEPDLDPLHRARLLAERGRLLCDQLDRPSEGRDLIAAARSLATAQPPSPARAALLRWLGGLVEALSPGVQSVNASLSDEGTTAVNLTDGPDQGALEGSVTRVVQPDEHVTAPISAGAFPAAPTAPTVDPEESFLGPARRVAGDRSRAAVRRRLARSKAPAAQGQTWPDLGRPALRGALDALALAADGAARAEAAAEVAERYEAAGADAEAVTAWREVLAWRAGHPHAIERLLVLCRRLGDHQALGQILAMAIERAADPDRRHALLREAADLHLQAGDPGAAVPHLRRALSERPHDGEIVLALAQALQGARRWADLVQVLTASGLIDGDPRWALAAGQILLHRLDDPARAAPLIERAAGALLGDPPDLELLRDLATVRAHGGALEEAVALLERALAQRPPAAVALQIAQAQASLIERHGEDPRRALALLRGAIARNPITQDARPLLEQAERLAVDLRAWPILGEILEALGQIADPAERRDLLIRLGHLRRARLDQPAEAAAAFTEAFELDPTDLKLRRLLASVLDGATAPDLLRLQIRLYDRWLQGPDLSAETQVDLGRRLAAAHEALDAPTEAARVLESIWAHLGPDPAAQGLMAPLERAYRRAGRWPALAQLYTTALAQADTDERRGLLLRHLARVQETGQRDLVSATETWHRILALTPDDLSALRSLCRLLEAQRRWDELIEASRREFELIDEDARRAHVLFRIGSLYEIHLGDREMARQAYARVLTLDADHFPALHGLRALAAEAGDHEAEIHWLQREAARWKKPRERAAILAQIAAIQRGALDQPHKAMDTFMQAYELWPACQPAALALGDHAYANGAWARAATFYQAVTAQRMDTWTAQDRAALFHRRGAIALRLGHPLEAAESLRIALDEDPQGEAALATLIEANGALDDPLAAQADLRARVAIRRRALEQRGAPAPERAAVEILEGHLARQRLDLAEAEAAYRQATALHGDALALWRPLVDLLVAQRRFDEAIAALDGLTQGPGDALSEADRLDALAWSARLCGDLAVDPARAEDRWVQIIQRTPGAADHRHRQARLALAQGAFIEGDVERAGFLLDRLLEEAAEAEIPDPERSQIHAYAGVVAHRGLADAAAARHHLDAALTLDPLNALALLALLRLLQQIHDDEAIAARLKAHGAFIAAAPPQDAQHGALKILAARLWAPLDPLMAQDLLEAHALGGPGARDARLALADLATAPGGAQIADSTAAVARLFTVLDEDVCDLEALAALADLAARLNDDDLRRRALEALDLFQALSAADQGVLLQLQSQARRRLERGPRDPGEAARRRLLHPQWRSPLVSLLTLCDPLIGGPLLDGPLLDGPLLDGLHSDPQPSLRRGDALTPKSRHPLALDLAHVYALIGAPRCDVYVRPEQPAPIRVWCPAPPSQIPKIVLGGPEDRWTMAQRRFLLGRAICLVHHGLGRLHDLSWPEAMALAAKIAALFTGSEGPWDQLTAHQAAQARRALGLDPEETVAPPLSPSEGPEAALVGITRTMDRCGLLAAGALRPAVESMVRLKDDDEISLNERGDLAWALRTVPRIRDLVRFWLSGGATPGKA